MEEKKIDNRIIRTKKEIKTIEDNIVSSKKALRELEYFEENISHLNRNLNQCVELLNMSVKNKKISQKLDVITNETMTSYKKTTLSISDEKEITKDIINKLDEKREKLNEELKNIYKEQEEKEEIIEAQE